jgi:hypothetical protein
MAARGGRGIQVPGTRATGGFAVLSAMLALAALLAVPCAPLHAQSRFGGNVALASQLVDRGLAITADTPVLQGELFRNSPGGWSFGVAGGAEAASGRPVIALARVSRAWALPGDWMAQAGLLYYDYRGALGGTVPDRVDANLYVTYRDTLTLGLSASHASGRHDQRLLGAADLGFRWPLAQHISVSAGAGIAQASIGSYGPPGYPYRAYRYEHVRIYGYGNLGLAWSDGPWRLQVDRTRSSLGARRAYGARSASPWVATLSRAF